MADQIEGTKIVAYALTGPNDDEIAVPKVIMYLLLEPGDIDDGGSAVRQSHVQAQIIRRS